MVPGSRPESKSSQGRVVPRDLLEVQQARPKPSQMYIAPGAML